MNTCVQNIKKPSRSVSLLGMILYLILGVSSVHAQDLENYQMEAAQNNPGLKAAYFDYQASLQKNAQVRSLPDPELSFAYFISPVETRLGPQNARISLTQMFPWFGSLKDMENGAHYETKALFQQFRGQRNLLFYQMELLWAELYQIEENIRLANENLDIVNTLVSISLRKYETGLVPQVDVLRAQIEQEDLKTHIRLLEDNRELLTARFNEMRNVNADEPVVIPGTLSTSSINTENKEQILQEIKANNPDLGQLRSLEDAARNAIEVASNNGLPSFGLGFDYIFTGERSDIASLSDNGKDALVARLSVKIPLFRGKYKAETQEASLKLNASRNRLDARENQLETNFYTAIRDLEDAQRRFSLYDLQQIQRVEQAVNILLQSYASDNSQFEEILRLHRKLFNYELERVKARTDEYQTLSLIKYLSGGHNLTTEEINY